MTPGIIFLGSGCARKMIPGVIFDLPRDGAECLLEAVADRLADRRGLIHRERPGLVLEPGAQRQGPLALRDFLAPIVGDKVDFGDQRIHVRHRPGDR